MKKLLIPLLCLVGVLFLGLSINDVANKLLIIASPSSSSYKTYRLFAAQPQSEIPILGSSRALANYVPSLLSPRAFNYGINGSGMFETLFMLKQALRNPNPGPILVNLDPWGCHGEYTPTVQGDYTLALGVPEVRQNVPHVVTDCIPGIRFYGKLRSSLTTWLDGKTALTRKVDHGAALILQSRSEKEWQIINAKIKDSTFHCTPSWQAEFDKIVATAEHPIVWIVSPIAPHWREHYHGEAAMSAFLATLAGRPHMYVVNLFKETVDYTEAEFVDPTHLNIYGATRFTQQLVPYLKALPIAF